MGLRAFLFCPKSRFGLSQDQFSTPSISGRTSRARELEDCDGQRTEFVNAKEDLESKE